MYVVEEEKSKDLFGFVVVVDDASSQQMTSEAGNAKNLIVCVLLPGMKVVGGSCRDCPG
jgi:hypothetical protein